MKALFLTLALGWGAGAVFAGQYYLNLAGVPGESASARHPNWIEVASFGQGVVRPNSATKPAFSQFSFTKPIDRSSPLLLAKAVPGSRIASGIFEAVSSGVTELRYLQVKMTNILVASFSQTGDRGELVDEVSLDFRTVEWTYTQFDGNGKVLTNIMCSWNRDTGRGVGGDALMDSDGDGMPDDYETFYGFNPLENDANRDADKDGATNLEEFRAGTNPVAADSVFRMTGRRLEKQVVLNWAPITGKQYRLLGARSPEGPFEPVRLLSENEAAAGETAVDTTPAREFFLIAVE